MYSFLLKTGTFHFAKSGTFHVALTQNYCKNRHYIWQSKDVSYSRMENGGRTRKDTDDKAEIGQIGRASCRERV